eukprot:354901-Chlamydomonas_euryale.AAC.7
MSGDDWVPAQERQPQAVDFRRYTTQPKGYKERNKRKLDDDYEAAAAAADAEPAVMELDGGEDAQQTVPAGKRRKAEGVAYIPVSEAHTQAHGLMLCRQVGILVLGSRAHVFSICCPWCAFPHTRFSSCACSWEGRCIGDSCGT